MPGDNFFFIVVRPQGSTRKLKDQSSSRGECLNMVGADKHHSSDNIACRNLVGDAISNQVFWWVMRDA